MSTNDTDRFESVEEDFVFDPSDETENGSEEEAEVQAFIVGNPNLADKLNSILREKKRDV
jgi:hypothetical protein